MANISGEQKEVQFCPKCKGNLRNIPRSEMKTHFLNRGGDVVPYTHTYECWECRTRFEINQDR